MLKETYGVILYQEQVMRISRDFAGFTPGQADVLRKAMGKKIPEEIEKLRGQFMEGAKAKDIKEKTAHEVFEQIVTFGGYGFNKSHSTAYGLVSYQTAFLKANYPIEFMTSLLTSEIGHSAVGKEEDSKLVNFINEAVEMGISVLPPDVQKSFSEFSIERIKPCIRFGLLAVKNVGTGAVEAIVEGRKVKKDFKTFDEFFQGVDLRQANRKVLESLIKAGAFDAFSSESAQRSRPWPFKMDLDGVMARSSKMREEAQSGQDSFFGWQEMAPAKKNGAGERRSEVRSETDSRVGWSEHELLACEKEVLGFYLSGHPLARFQSELNLFSSHRLNQRNRPASGATVRVAGMISNVRRMVTKAKKEPYARCRFEDLEGEIDMIVFPKAYASGISQHLKPSEMVVVTGKINRRAEDGAPELLVEEMSLLAKAREQYVSELMVRMTMQGLEGNVLQELKDVLSRYPGRCRVCVEVETPPEGTVIVETDFSVKPTAALFEEIEKRLGHESWKITKIGR